MEQKKRKGPKPVELKQIGKQLGSYRKDMGLTRKALGKLAGVHPITISNYEKGKVIPRGTTIVRTATALGRKIQFHATCQ